MPVVIYACVIDLWRGVGPLVFFLPWLKKGLDANTVRLYTLNETFREAEKR
jgi:hypothetical protein